MHTSLVLIEQLDKFLESACRRPQVRTNPVKLIDYFDGKDPGRLLEYTTHDINLGKVLIRFGKNMTSDTYIMLMHQSVKPDPNKNYVWHGPTFYLDMVAMEMLQEYLHWKQREDYSEPPSSPEQNEGEETEEEDEVMSYSDIHTMLF